MRRLLTFLAALGALVIASVPALADKIGTATVECEQKDIDRYKGIVAVCWLSDLHLNGWLVSEVWALDYRRYSDGQHADQEAAATTARRGI